jgi:hypothetical protein
LSVFVAKPVLATTMINECNKEVRVAYAVLAQGGVDSLTSEGSWSRVQSVGWYRIGPFQREESPAGYTHVLVEIGGEVLSNLDPAEPTSMGACMQFGANFDVSVTQHDNRASARETRHPVSECLFSVPVKIGDGKTYMRWMPFQKIKGDDRYTIVASSCGRTTPASRTRLMWSPDKSPEENYFVWYAPNEYVWAKESIQKKDREQKFSLAKIDADWVSLRGVNTVNQILYHALGKNHQRRVEPSKTWEDLGAGSWIR